MPENKNNKKARIRILSVVVLIVIAGLAAYGLFLKDKSSRKATGGDTPLFTVESGQLTISVTESGTIKAQDQVILKSEIEGRTTVLWLIPEAARVKKGDLLVELDATQLADNLIKQQIDVQNSEASFIKAREDLAVGKNQAQSDIEKAELTLQFAKQDLEKYIKGEYPNLLKEAETKITLNLEEEGRAEDKYKSSKELAADKYISALELKSDELAWKKAKLTRELSESDLKLLEDYTYTRNIAQLESDVKQAGMALERIKRKASADVVQAEAQLKAAESVLEQEKNILEKSKQQIAKAKIYAPSDGMVVYASSTKASHRWGNQEPLDIGQEVQQYEELIHLPTADSVKAEISIHESNLNKVKVGFPARITVDTQPGVSFHGEVTKIAVMPNAQMIFINPDLKVYTTEVNILEESKELKTGMSCKTEIMVAEYDNVFYVPVQAVVKIGNQTTVYVMDGGKMKPRNIEVGMDNNRMIHVISGLKQGEKVVLTPPLSDAQVKNNRNGRKQNGKSSRPDKGPEDMKSPDGMKRPDGMPRPQSGEYRPRGDRS